MEETSDAASVSVLGAAAIVGAALVLNTYYVVERKAPFYTN
jgi:hypothetical protein